MMLIDRYIFRTIVSATLVALLVLLILEFFLSLLVELESLGKGGYDFVAAFSYLLLIQPQRLYELFPMALLVGGLLGMGTLANGNELIVMRTAGLSLSRLTLSTLQAGFTVSLVVLAIGEFVAPSLEQIAHKQRAVDRGENLAIRGGRGFWARDGDYFIHVNSVRPGIRLADIQIFSINADAQLTRVVHAQEAQYVKGHWQLQGIKRTILDGDTASINLKGQLAINLAISPEILDVLAASPSQLSIRDLSVYVAYLRQNGLDAQSYQLAFWRKVLAPLTYLTMLVVAMPFVFGQQRSTGVGYRLVTGLLLGLAFFLVNYLLGSVVLLYGYPPLWGAALPSLFFLGLGFWALNRLR